MKAFLAALLAGVIITVGSNLILGEIGFSAQDATTKGQSVRVGSDG